MINEPFESVKGIPDHLGPVNIEYVGCDNKKDPQDETPLVLKEVFIERGKGF